MGNKSLVFFINLIIIKLMTIILSSTCTEKETPFLKDNECVSYCSKEELQTKKCIIDEETAKIKFITNLIIIGSKNYRYININSNKNNEMIIFTSKDSGIGERLFYGLKTNGRFLFEDENSKEFPYLYYNIEMNETNYQPVDFGFIQLNTTSYITHGKEYYIMVGKGDQYAEAFGFEKKNHNKGKPSAFCSKTIYSDRGIFTRLQANYQNITYAYYKLTVTKEIINDDAIKYGCNLRALKFSTNNMGGNLWALSESTDTCSENKMITSFQTSNNKIINFYRKNDKFKIMIQECCFTKKREFEIEETYSPNTFYKGIHLKKEVGVFVYFVNETSTSPYILIKNFPSWIEMEDYNSFEKIELNNIFNYDYMLNDIVKISDSKICYISPNLNKEELNVVILTFYNNDTSLNISYYLQPIYAQNHFMIYKELRLYLYSNQFVTLGASVCNSSNCIENTDEHYASFLIFSYPNSSDVDINLINLLNKTNEDIKNISFNLEENSIIENNLFGFVIKGIKIFNYSEYIQLISTKTHLPINLDDNDILSPGENISLIFNSDESYSISNYTIEYALVVIESDYDEQYKLTEKIERYNIQLNENILEKETYIGKTSYYNIIIEKELTTKKCNNIECSLSLSDDKSICITCNSYYYFEDYKKICEVKEISNSIYIAFPISTTIPIKFSSDIDSSTTTSTLSISTIIPTNIDTLTTTSTLPISKTTPTIISTDIDISTTIYTLPISTTIPIIISTDIDTSTSTSTLPISTTIPTNIDISTTTSTLPI